MWNFVRAAPANEFMGGSRKITLDDMGTDAQIASFNNWKMSYGKMMASSGSHGSDTEILYTPL